MKNSTIFSLFLVGAGTGWLVGLSFSPVVGSVLGSILGIAGAVVAAAAGVPLKDRTSPSGVRAAPLAALVLGIALFAPAGIITRDHAWLAPSVEERARRARILQTAGGSATSSMSARPMGGLHATELATVCERLVRTPEADLARAFEATGDSLLVVVARVVDDPGRLAEIREGLCRR